MWGHNHGRQKVGNVLCGAGLQELPVGEQAAFCWFPGAGDFSFQKRETGCWDLSHSVANSGGVPPRSEW